MVSHLHLSLHVLPFLALDAVHAVQRRSTGLWAWLHAPANLFKLAYALLTIGGVLSLHAIHKAMFTPWNFGSRHGLTAGFAIVAALMYLARRPVLGRVIALFLVCAGAYFGFWRLAHGPDAAEAHEWGAAQNQAITDWLHDRAAAEPGLVVVAPDIEVQKLARFTDGVGYHWFYRTTTWDEIDFFFGERGARYLLLHDGHAPWLRLDARNKQVFSRRFTPVAADLSGFSVYRPRQPGDPAAAWPDRPERDSGDE